MLGFLDSGFRNFANSRRPIVEPADLRGMKIRTPPIPVILDTMKALGALPQAIPFGQVYTALQSHVVDGIEPEIRDFQDQKWFEAAKFLTISNYIWTANFWYVNKDRYDGLPATQRQALDKAAADTVAWYRAQLDSTYARVLGELEAGRRAGQHGRAGAVPGKRRPGLCPLRRGLGQAVCSGCRCRRREAIRN